MPAELIEELFNSLEGGQVPEWAVLRARFPDSAAAISQVEVGIPLFQALCGNVPRSISVLPVGERLGDFEILSILGRGGMGAVYRARQHGLHGRQVALKVIQLDGLTDNQIARFELEAKHAASLHHENLAEIYTFDRTDACLYYAMQLVEGPNLEQILKTLNLRPSLIRNTGVIRRIVEYVTDVASGLGHVHRQGLVHRDVKPANIIVDATEGGGDPLPRGRAILVDFGLAKVVSPAASTVTAGGALTFPYAAPEQLQLREVTSRTDVFALGATLHDLLSPSLPRDRGPAAEGLPWLCTINPAVDESLAAIVHAAVEKRSALRYPDGAALAADLRAWLLDDPVWARTMLPWERWTRHVRRHPWRAIRGAGLAVAISLAAWFMTAVGDWLASTTRARTAIRDGDLMSACGEIQRTPDVVARVLLHDKSLRLLSRELRSTNSTDPRVLVFRLMNGHLEREALLTGASVLQIDGLDAHRELLAFFVHNLTAGGGDDLAITQEVRSWTTLLLARLFLEEPVRSPVDVATTAKTREALWDVLQRSDLGEDRLYALSALAGCGTPDMIPRLLEWLEHEPPGREEVRLGLLCCEYILRRSYTCGTAAMLGPREALSASEGAKRLIAARLSAAGLPDTDATSVLKAFLIHRRKQGETLPLAWMNLEMDDRSELRGFDGLFYRLRYGHGPDRRSAENAAEAAGWRAEFHRDRTRDTLDSLEAVIMTWPTEFRRGTDSTSMWFARGRERYLLEASGFSPERDALDPSTFLSRAAVHRGPPIALRAERGSSAAELSRGRIAGWEFTSGVVWFSGTAGAALAVEVEPCSTPDGGRAVFSTFGKSELVLEFSTADIPPDRTLGLILKHGKRLRGYLPRRGMAYLEIEFDGVRVHPAFGVTTFACVEEFIPLLDGRAPPRDSKNHRVSIRLTDASTTVYQIASASIESRL